MLFRKNGQHIYLPSGQAFSEKKYDSIAFMEQSVLVFCLRKTKLMVAQSKWSPLPNWFFFYVACASSPFETYGKNMLGIQRYRMERQQRTIEAKENIIWPSECILKIRMKVNSCSLLIGSRLARITESASEKKKKCVPPGNIDCNLCTKFKRKQIANNILEIEPCIRFYFNLAGFLLLDRETMI